jgi:hypothetical protein
LTGSSNWVPRGDGHPSGSSGWTPRRGVPGGVGWFGGVGGECAGLGSGFHLPPVVLLRVVLLAVVLPLDRPASAGRARPKMAAATA